MPSITIDLPTELTALRQWLIWRYVQLPDKEKPTKVPFTCQGYRASATNPQHWSTYAFALDMASRPGFADGIGFVFTADDPYCGVDLDNCYPSDAAECAPWAAGILERFADTYSEESPSGSGVKLWCKAKAPRCGRWIIGSGAIEIYDHARYFAVTGRSAGITAIIDHQADIEVLIANLDSYETHSRPSREISDVIPQGQRHNTLVSLAGTMCRRGMDAAAIEAALLVVNERQCDPPYSAEHIRQIVRSTSRWSR